MKIPFWLMLAGGAVVGYFALQQFAPDVLASITGTVTNAISGITGGTAAGAAPQTKSNAAYRSNRVTYYNPNNYRANVAYGYGPQSASGTYNSIPFSDY